MTEAQRLVKDFFDQSQRKTIDFDAIQFKIVNNKEQFFRFVPDANTENQMFFQAFKTYKLSDKVYVNYPNGTNMVQGVLNHLWSTDDSTARALYSSFKGKQSYNVGVVECDSKGNVVNPEAKILKITSKKLWENIMELYFQDDFLANPTIYFSLKRVGEKLDTEYFLNKLTGAKIDFTDVKTINLSLPLAFKKSDDKALPLLLKLKKQFSLPVSLPVPGATITPTPVVIGKTPVQKSDDDSDDMDDFERQLMSQI